MTFSTQPDFIQRRRLVNKIVFGIILLFNSITSQLVQKRLSQMESAKSSSEPELKTVLNKS